MKKILLVLTILLSMISCESGQKKIKVEKKVVEEKIVHSDQITEIKFTGNSYDLGVYVGRVAKNEILDGIDRFDKVLGVMLPGLSVDKLSKKFDEKDVYEKLRKSSPNGAAYIDGLSKSLGVEKNILLTVAMSDEAILESQVNGGLGFLESKKGHDPKAPSKCSVFGINNENGKGWAGANFDYMGINYTGLIVLNHIDIDGKTKIMFTWAGLIPYGGISKGGQAILMNTMADEGTARENAKGEIISSDAIPSFYLSWEPYNIGKPEEIIDIYKRYKKYTAYFSYTVVDGKLPVLNIENNYGGEVHFAEGLWKVHTNHSIYKKYDFVDEKFGANSTVRYDKIKKFMDSSTIDTSEEEVRNLLESKPVWKGRGEMMGTVTSTYYTVDEDKVDAYIKTDSDHKAVHIKNY